MEQVDPDKGQDEPEKHMAIMMICWNITVPVIMEIIAPYEKSHNLRSEVSMVFRKQQPSC